MSQFYLLREPQGLPESKYAKYTDDVDFETIRCPKVRGHQRAGKRTTKLFLAIPNTEANFIKTWYSDWLIDNKVVKVFKENKITGYKLDDILIVSGKRKGANFNKKLHELVVIGQGGNIHSSSGYKLLEVCDKCGAKKFKDFDHGIVVDKQAWDKSDIFKLQEYGYILVTQKVKDLVEQNNLQGCVFIPAEKFKLNPILTT